MVVPHKLSGALIILVTSVGAFPHGSPLVRR